ncbi:MAG: hypothetical protein KIT84_18195 [Labilithrix sp.]|nr:hypothetical protein [Labilithrix sp.]MCW5812964.1 hypothetical protein [Labilithrix sp.]
MWRLSQACLFIIAFFAMIEAAHAAPLKVRVRGAAKISARGWREQVGGDAARTELVLSGTLTDDASLAMPGQPVIVRVARETDPHDAMVAEGIRAARSCDRGHAQVVKVQGPREAPEVAITTDEAGRFCFRAPLEPDRYKATVVFAPPGGRGLVDGAEREIGFDLSRRGLALKFDPEPKVLELDTPRVTVEAVALHDDEDSPHVAPGLVVVLSNEKEEIARATSDGSGRARFAFSGAKAGPPGVGELRASFAGNTDIAATTTTHEIERHVKVNVKVPAAERGELEPKVPEEGIPIVADVTSSLGPVGEGSIEARVGEVVVGAAPVERGIARLTLTFATTSSEAFVRLRYVPSAPWYEPIGEPVIRVPIRGPSLLSKAPLLLAGLAVIAFFLVGRVSGPKIKPEPAPGKPDPLPDPTPRIEVVRPAERGQEGWTGKIVDAHEGTPIAGARVWIERGTFDGRASLVGFETGPDGRFTLKGIGPIAGDESIIAEGHLHARLSQTLPAPGELTIALAARRRALLAQLVAFAKKRGAPFDVRPEPTPGHVRRAAQGDPREAGAAKWAAAMENAVFGPGDVDARTEAEVARLEPDKPADPTQR